MPTTTRNPQANSIIERIYQTIGNIIRSFQIENKKRIPHNYRVGDKVLYRVEWVSKYNENPYDGPYKIV